ncbi:MULTISPECIES: universal stress protein [Gynuella]|uniref:Universal stress protein UspA and related nucleotide-binding protein n=1 Tax=Gynuella sunshinyii YC6258 TaxID=1445510 RepID=A0A0C5VSH6_9GAMM|nr:universal stress protein [Gynuella sunshinyii]AJQ96253.1 universal stress protein UspA and related nucleotide-binding protein [Gynuella sunshinyii YC6258]
MSTTLIVGIDGSEAGQRALAHAKRLATLIGDCTLTLVYVIEWSPYSFQTPEENALRKKRREEAVVKARTRVIEPNVENLIKEGFQAEGVVLHGKVAQSLNSVALEKNADQIIVARASEHGLTARVFGSATANLVMHASVPVTVVS